MDFTIEGYDLHAKFFAQLVSIRQAIVLGVGPMLRVN